MSMYSVSIPLAKFKYVDEFNGRRRKIAEIYTKGLAGIGGLILPIIDFNHVFHQYTIRVQNGRRDELQKYLKEKGISTMVYYPVPLHKMKVFKGRMKITGNLIESQKAVNEVLSLPIEPLMKKEEVIKVAQEIRGFYGN